MKRIESIAVAFVSLFAFIGVALIFGAVLFDPSIFEHPLDRKMRDLLKKSDELIQRSQEMHASYTPFKVPFNREEIQANIKTMKERLAELESSWPPASALWPENDFQAEDYPPVSALETENETRVMPFSVVKGMDNPENIQINLETLKDYIQWEIATKEDAAQRMRRSTQLVRVTRKNMERSFYEANREIHADLVDVYTGFIALNEGMLLLTE